MVKDLNTDFTLHNSLFRSVKLTKNAEPDKYKYSSFGIGFDSRSESSFTDPSMGNNAIIFGADMSSSVHIDNKNKDILQIYPINFLQPRKRFLLSLCYNGNNSSLLVNAAIIYQFKAKGSEIKYYALFVGNILKDFTLNKMKKIRLKGSVNLFLVDFNPMDTNDILDIHSYLMKGKW